MFEDLDDLLRSGKKSAGRGDDDDGITSGFNSNKRHRPSEEDIAKILRREFGGNVQAVPGGILMGGGKEHEEIFNKIEGLISSLAYMAEQLGVRPVCVEATNQELQVGDILKCPGGEIKTVLKVGWKFAVLSHTDNQTKVDGPWFEEEINRLNFIKKI